MRKSQSTEIRPFLGQHVHDPMLGQNGGEVQQSRGDLLKQDSVVQQTTTDTPRELALEPVWYNLIIG